MSKEIKLNVRELRIGNLINRKGEYSSVGCSDFREIRDARFDYEFTPIPITDDILKRCGFSDSEESNEWFHKDEPLFGVLSFAGTTRHIWDGAYTDAPCNSLHQLQNLYYSLTGQELSIDSTTISQTSKIV